VSHSLPPQVTCPFPLSVSPLSPSPGPFGEVIPSVEKTGCKGSSLLTLGFYICGFFFLTPPPLKTSLTQVPFTTPTVLSDYPLKGCGFGATPFFAVSFLDSRSHTMSQKKPPFTLAGTETTLFEKEHFTHHVFALY